jgi:heme oxygenase (biliverdin-IX-beta and delta-forming)
VNASPRHLLERLRAATHDDHRGLDRHPLLASLVRPGLAPRHYATALLAMHGPQAVLERCVAVGLRRHAAGDYRPPARCPALEDDLHRLGLAPRRVGTPPTTGEGPGALLGRLYVLEGSRLGGRVLAARVREALGPEVPLAFFGGAEGSRHWPRFLAFIEARHLDDEAADDAVIAAREAFARFRQGLDDQRMRPLSA